MSSDFASRLFTINRYPIRYLVIPKCGCTFTKNLLWRLEHGEQYSNPVRIHDRDSSFIRASDLNLSVSQIRQEQFAFTIIRNPVDRFFSLYTDKIIGDGHKMYVPLREVLHKKYGLNVTPKSIGDHTQNCEILIDWIEKNLMSEVDLERESHWTPQVNRLDVIKAFNLKLLILKDLNSQLTVLLSELIPDIASILSGIEGNKSVKEYPKESVLTQSLRRSINNVYKKDRQIFELLRDAWGKPVRHSSDVPRFENLPDLN